jgi:hypothetical protein
VARQDRDADRGDGECTDAEAGQRTGRTGTEQDQTDPLASRTATSPSRSPARAANRRDPWRWPATVAAGKVRKVATTRDRPAAPVVNTPAVAAVTPAATAPRASATSRAKDTAS